MDNSELTNFSLHRPLILKEHVSALWVNTEGVKDLKMSLVDTSLSETNPEFAQKVEDSWKRLELRAEANLPKNSPFLFYNSKVLNFEGIPHDLNKSKVINVSKGISYKTIASVRSDQELYNDIDRGNTPCAFVIVSILVTGDNKLVFGKRKYYGDWPYHTYETAGAFLKEEDLGKDSLIRNAADKVKEDFNNIEVIKTIPFVMYKLPRVMETILLCISKTEQISSELTSDFYSELLITNNTIPGMEKVLEMPLNQFHPPSRIVIQTYYENFDVAQKLLQGFT